MVGHGTIDIKACMSILSEVGYKGAYALELGHPEPFEKGVEQAMGCLKKSLNFSTKIMGQGAKPKPHILKN